MAHIAEIQLDPTSQAVADLAFAEARAVRDSENSPVCSLPTFKCKAPFDPTLECRVDHIIIPDAGFTPTLRYSSTAQTITRFGHTFQVNPVSCSCRSRPSWSRPRASPTRACPAPR
jgi:hypothetical protein